MKKLIFAAFCVCTLCLQAQTLEQARKMVQDGDFPKAEKALKNLAARRNADASLLLAQTYLKNYRFEEADEYFNTFKTLSEKAKKPVAPYEKEMGQASTGLQMMLGVVDVAIIDSMVVDKRAFLDAYKLSHDAGQLFWYNEFFNKQGENWGTVYQTELGNNILFGDNGKIYSSAQQLNEWGTPVPLSANVNSTQSNNYPFLCSDGVTLYFASMGHNALGGYDLFVTRFDTDANDYLQPDNVGMPFNSTYNDYMMAIDEEYKLGWFASDRYQPDGKVCVYVFIPNEGKKTYDIDAYDDEQLIRLARITSLKESWKGREKQVEEARARLAKARSEAGLVQNKKQADFYFVVNDAYTYTMLEDFKSSTARKKAEKWVEEKKKLAALEQALEGARDQYAAASASQKKSMSLSILDQEKRIRTLQEDIWQQETDIRNTEIMQLTK